MTEFGEQFVFDLDVSVRPSEQIDPVLSRHVKAGPGRLLRKLVAGGLDPQAVEAAAALVVALDEESAG